MGIDDGRNPSCFLRCEPVRYKSALRRKWQYGECETYFPNMFCFLPRLQESNIRGCRWSMSSLTSGASIPLFKSSILLKQISIVNVYPLSSFRAHYPHLGDACFSIRSLKFILFSWTRLHSKQPPINTQLSSRLQSVFLCAGAFPLTCDIEPPLPMCLCHDDAHHVSDRLRFHDGEGEVGLVKRDWLGRGRRVGDPLDVEPRCGRARRAALVCGFNLEISTQINILMRALLKIELLLGNNHTQFGSASLTV